MRCVFFDLETTGLEVAKHEVIQIGAVAVSEELKQLGSFERKLTFNREAADQDALLLNGWSADAWDREAVSPKVGLLHFAEFLRQYADVPMVSKAGRPYRVAQLVGQNAATFDGPFLQAAFRKCDLFLPGTFRVLDTLQRALWHFHERPDLKQPRDFHLATLAEYFSVPLTRAHDAMEDALATLEVYRAILGIRETKPTDEVAVEATDGIPANNPHKILQQSRIF